MGEAMAHEKLHAPALLERIPVDHFPESLFHDLPVDGEQITEEE